MATLYTCAQCTMLIAHCVEAPSIMQEGVFVLRRFAMTVWRTGVSNLAPIEWDNQNCSTGICSATGNNHRRVEYSQTPLGRHRQWTRYEWISKITKIVIVLLRFQFHTYTWTCSPVEERIRIGQTSIMDERVYTDPYTRIARLNTFHLLLSRSKRQKCISSSIQQPK